MAITELHLRLLWGAFDLSTAEGETPTYQGATQIKSLGNSANQGDGTAARRCTLIIDRSAASPADDVATMHFDFVNFTSGDPDDTWTTGDYTTLEGLIDTWWTAVGNTYSPTWCRLSGYRWHRAGPGITPPNAATRSIDKTTPIAGGASGNLPPQSATTVTFRTGMRRHWGRTYLPLGKALAAGTSRLSNTDVDTLTATTVTLLQGAATADFAPVVLGPTGAFTVENVEVDNVSDVQRRRRWKHTTYRKITAL